MTHRAVTVLVRNGGEQRRVHQSLKLLVVRLEVDLQVRAVGIDSGRVNGSFFDGTGIELLVKHAGLDDGGERCRRHRVCCFFFFNDTATTEIYTLSYTTLFR